MHKVFYGPRHRIKISIHEKRKFVPSLTEDKTLYHVQSLPNTAHKNTSFYRSKCEYYGGNKNRAIYSAMLVFEVDEHLEIRQFIEGGIS